MKATIAVLCFFAAVACSRAQLWGAGPISGGQNPNTLPGMEGGNAGPPSSGGGQAGPPYVGREVNEAGAPARG
uniref:Putative secreted protein n=1 Tax=Ixodes scapularis TaxID=6945 RepID=Q4PMZ0_IXOSC|nr:putative secreted protein [Ixodes scapularis]